MWSGGGGSVFHINTPSTGWCNTVHRPAAINIRIELIRQLQMAKVVLVSDCTTMCDGVVFSGQSTHCHHCFDNHCDSGRLSVLIHLTLF